MATKFQPNKNGVVKGTAKADKITWLSSKDWKKALTVNGLAGNDVIDFKKSKYKKNKLNGGDGNDKIYGGTNIDIINGGNGNDQLFGYNGNDSLLAGKGNDTVKGGNGNDIINGQYGTNKLYGEAGNDSIYGGTGNDYIYGGAGTDYINAGKGTNYIYLSKNEGKDTIVKGGGSDTVVFSSEKNFNNFKFYYSGNDLLFTASGATALLKDFALGGHSAKYLQAGNVKLNLSGKTGSSSNDLIILKSGTNTISGGKGNDLIYCGSGNDTISGGAGNDELYGGKGNNTFVFKVGDGNDTVYNNDGTDTLSFAAGTDVSITYKGNDLKVTYGNGVTSNTITVKNYKTIANHSVKYVKIGDGEAQNIKNLITIGTTEYFNYHGDAENILQRGVYGTDNSETLAGTPTGYNANNLFYGEHYFTYGGNDNVVLRTKNASGDNLSNFVHFKVGDGQDIVKNSEWNKDGAVQGSELQAIYQEKIYTETKGRTNLDFKGVHLDSISAVRDDNDILITYTTTAGTDTVRVENGYWSTTIDEIHAYNINSSVNQVTQPLYYGEGYPGSAGWINTRQAQQTTDYGYGYGVDTNGLINGTLWYETTTLRDLLKDKTIVDGEEETLSGWIWSDSISASDGTSHTINGYGGNDTLTGGAMADVIYGGEGHDIINGGDGNDVIYGYRHAEAESQYISDNDFINGGAGNDTIYGEYGYDTINGGAGEDEIHGATYITMSGTNYKYAVVNGGADNDTIIAGGLIHGDGGDDDITGSGHLYGDEGNDAITAIANKNNAYDTDAEGNEVYLYVDGGDGNDTINLSLNYTTRNASVLGGAGNDEIGTTRHYDNQEGKWVFESVTRDVNIDAGSGNDHIVIRSDQRTQNVTIQGGAGDDVIEYQYSFRADYLANGTQTDASVIKDLSGTDSLALIGTNNMSYHGATGATPAVFFDMTIDDEGNITSLGEDTSLYIATTYGGSLATYNAGAYGDKTKSLRLENVLSINNSGELSSSIEGIYIRGDWIAVERGYYKLDVQALATAYANYLKTTQYRSMAAALADSTIKNSLVVIGMGSWAHTMYRPVFESDDQAIYGNDTDQTLDADYGYVIGGSGNETINGSEYDDYLDGRAGDDELHGYAGNDTLLGGGGNNTFVFAVGDGTDTIKDATNNDVIKINSAVDFEVTKNANNKLQIAYGTDKIIVDNYNFEDSSNSIDTLYVKKAEGGYTQYSISDLLEPDVTVTHVSSEDMGQEFNLSEGNNTVVFDDAPMLGYGNTIISANTSGNGYTDTLDFRGTNEEGNGVSFMDTSLRIYGSYEEGYTDDLWLDATAYPGCPGDGDIIYKDFYKTTAPNVVIIDNDRTYSAKGYNSAQASLTLADDTTNRVVAIKADEGTSVVTSNGNYNQITTFGGGVLTYTYGGGHDNVWSLEFDTDDTYNVALTSDTSVNIADWGGDNDSLIITGTELTNLRILFNIENDGDYTAGRYLLTCEENVSSATLMAAANPEVFLTSGINVIGNASQIENVTVGGSAVNIDSWCDSIVAGVQSWLTNEAHAYDSVYDALCGENPCTDAEAIGQLVACYTGYSV